MKKNTSAMRSVIIISIIALSVILGFVISGIWTAVDKKMYPRDYSDLVEKYAAEYAVPEHLIYAVIKTESGFDSGKTGEDGGVGLMGVTPEEFRDMQSVTKEKLTDDALYGPETNIKYGTLRLSILYNAFENWDAVYAGWCVGLADAKSWAEDETCYNEDGDFVKVPDEAAVELGHKIEKCASKYRELYY
ncbi:MAG: transglycosylase SLT domain-containing protein [Clostridia bacterium]|nr:transglycosylase SLT domain-containing protein [Clostridia bacterium]